MSASLDDILNSLLVTPSKLAASDRARLQDLVTRGNTLVEVLNFSVRKYSPRLVSLLEPVIDEVFVDFHVSVTLAMVGQFKSACVLLRTCVETALYVLYFFDHPIEAYLWANHSKDMSFKSVLEEIANPRYFQAATSQYPPKGAAEKLHKNLLDSYRVLSERVHGKYEFLQLTAGKDESLLSTFAGLAEQCTGDLIHLSLLRNDDVDQVRAKVPTLARIL